MRSSIVNTLSTEELSSLHSRFVGGESIHAIAVGVKCDHNRLKRKFVEEGLYIPTQSERMSRVMKKNWENGNYRKKKTVQNKEVMNRLADSIPWEDAYAYYLECGSAKRVAERYGVNMAFFYENFPKRGYSLKTQSEEQRIRWRTPGISNSYRVNLAGLRKQFGYKNPVQMKLFKALKGADLEHSLWPFVVDIALVVEKVAIECDGKNHRYGRQAKIDIQKEAHLVSLGWRLLRFSYERILNEFESCVNEINNLVKEA